MSADKKNIAFLSPETHGTILEVRLKAFRENFRFYKSLLRSNTQVVAMVKAFAYGVGISKLAHVLQEEKVDYLAVAYIDEGVALRKIGISAPIMVFNPEPSGFHNMLKYNLEPEVFSIQFFNTLTNFIKNQKPSAPLPIHLKLDTGMNRLGLKEDELSMFIDVFEQNHDNFCLSSVFSHMSASENEAHDDFSTSQIVAYNKMCEMLQRILKQPFKKHILNSSGIARFPQAQLDMVRIGLGLFGISSVPEIQKSLQEVCVLKSRIAQIKDIRAGESVGYSRAFIATKNMRLGMVFIGYADGIPRALSNGKGGLFVNGKIAPIVGNVCMDITMIDLTNIDAEVSDEVIVFGGPIPIQKFAQNLQTIPYEVLTDLSTRVRRVYID